MKRITLPVPPSPDDSQYRTNPFAYSRALYQWANETKGKLEQASVFNDTPLDQPFTLGSYTLSTALSGTSTGTDISNYICSVVAALTRKGIISPYTQGGNK